ncbi:MAG: acyl carrier protein [Hamadaea sp.]|uniref:acyl carrier protein n=1 Tax=Hamadaea sp. TaxID=2024425 RepID=UPI0017CB4533|nr:acyl carrier protein [Hamadaea sp.]NUT19793.1 acyl carrier protein [Hamadaea sp.]
MMSEQAIEAGIADSIAAVAGQHPGTVTATDHLAHLGVSSLLLFVFVSDLEGRFAMKIPDDDLRPEHFTTIGAVSAMIRDILTPLDRR